MLFLSDYNAFEVVNFVLDYFGCPAGKGFQASLELFILVLDLYGLIALTGANSGERKAALLGVVSAALLDNFGIEHEHIFAVIIKGDYAL